MEGPEGYAIAVAIKNALVRMEAASLRRPRLTVGRSGLQNGDGNHEGS